jgi:hypothetical protein
LLEIAQCIQTIFYITIAMKLAGNLMYIFAAAVPGRRV